MTPADKGRFCASCQKQVFDFTNSADREIATTLKNGAACGRFKESQLDRELIIPKEKNTVWIAASAAVVSFFTLGSDAVKAQEPQTEINSETSRKSINTLNLHPDKIKVTVVDYAGFPIPGTQVINQRTKKISVTDFNGISYLDVLPLDILELRFVGMQNVNFKVDSQKEYTINMQYDILDEEIYVGAYKITHRTFFGRIFKRIGNLFR